MWEPCCHVIPSIPCQYSNVCTSMPIHLVIGKHKWCRPRWKGTHTLVQPDLHCSLWVMWSLICVCRALTHLLKPWTNSLDHTSVRIWGGQQSNSIHKNTFPSDHDCTTKTQHWGEAKSPLSLSQLWHWCRCYWVSPLGLAFSLVALGVRDRDHVVMDERVRTVPLETIWCHHSYLHPVAMIL